MENRTLVEPSHAPSMKVDTSFKPGEHSILNSVNSVSLLDVTDPQIPQLPRKKFESKVLKKKKLISPMMMLGSREEKQSSNMISLLSGSGASQDEK